jgi:phage-related protein (TIGR01555 family)
MNEEENLTLEQLAEQLIVDAATNIKASDGLENVVSGLGGTGDKTTYNQWKRSNGNQDQEGLITRFREDWIAQKICTIVPLDTTRMWRELDSPDAQEADAHFNLAGLFNEAYKWARVYGTSAILLDLKGSGKMDTPLDLKRLKVNCINSLQVIDRTRLMGSGQINMDPLSACYGQPEFYMIAGSTARIHYSRLIRFEGTRLPMYENWNNQWYSDSVLLPLNNLIDNFHTAVQAAAHLVVEANTDVITINGLQNMLSNPQGEAAVMKRFRLMKIMKSQYNLIMLDSNEVYDTKKIALNGVKDIIWEYLEVIAAAVGIPATRFLSASPSGMNATGESDLVNYIDLLAAIQKMEYEPKLKILDIIVQAHFGIPEWKYEWRCIFPESAAQKEAKDKDTIASVVLLVTAGVLTVEAAQRILFTKNVYSKEDMGEVPTGPPVGAAKISRPSDGPDKETKN